MNTALNKVIKSSQAGDIYPDFINLFISHPSSVINGIYAVITGDSIGDKIILSGSILDYALFYYTIGMGGNQSVNKVGTVGVSLLYLIGSGKNAYDEWRLHGKVSDSNLIGMGSGLLGSLSVHDSFYGKFAGIAAAGLILNGMTQEEGSTIIWDHWINEFKESGKSLTFQGELEIIGAQAVASVGENILKSIYNSAINSVDGSGILKVQIGDIGEFSTSPFIDPALIHEENTILSSLFKENQNGLKDPNNTDSGSLNFLVHEIDPALSG